MAEIPRLDERLCIMRTASSAYDVSSDARFLMVRRKNPVTPTRIRVGLNWPDVFGLDED